MVLNKASGNMYDWVDCTHTHIRGRCPHECAYCFVQHMRCARFYQGPLILKESELKVNYYMLGKGKTIFVEHMTDLFAEGVPEDNIERVLAHCREYHENTYVFQTKNPARPVKFYMNRKMPEGFILGATIETDDEKLTNRFSKAPEPADRARYLGMVKNHTTFLTIEPIMKFNLHELSELVKLANPYWVNIGADSKNQHLPEPTWNEVMALIDELKANGIEVREKSNLERLKKDG